MDSTDKKIKRIKVFKLRVENKAGKTEFFHNVSEILLEAMGWYYFKETLKHFKLICATKLRGSC